MGEGHIRKGGWFVRSAWIRFGRAWGARCGTRAKRVCLMLLWGMPLRVDRTGGHRAKPSVGHRAAKVS